MANSGNRHDQKFLSDVQIIVAVITAVSVIIAAFIGTLPTILSNLNPPETPSAIKFQVRVQSIATNENIDNAKVTLETPGSVPQEKLTDNNGVTEFTIDSRHEGDTIKLIIESPGFSRYSRNILLHSRSPIEQIGLTPIP